jgi:flagellar biosynthesis protein FlhF
LNPPLLQDVESMRVKRYVGRSLPELMRQVHEDLGKDAVLLKVRDETRRGLWKLFGRGRAEIVAGTGIQVVGGADARPPSPRPPSPAARAYGASPPRAAVPVPAPPAGPRADDLWRELREMKSLLEAVQKHMLTARAGAAPERFLDEYLRMTSACVSEALARKVVQNLEEKLPPDALRDPQAVRGALRATLLSLIPTGGPIRLERGRSRRIAFVGPTGVGKTTTIAKLAAQYAVRERRRVALLTNDTYRIAASDQLRKIAEIINQAVEIPFRVVPDAAAARAALDLFSDRDLILIDTAGRGQRDARKMDELRAFLDAVKPDQTHLVVSLTTHPDTLVDIVERFSAFSVDHLVVTKLDETAKFGILLDVLVKVRKTLSYVTTGQKIPDDIQPADAGRLADLVLAGSGAE